MTDLVKAFAQHGITVEAVDLAQPGGLNQRAGNGAAILIALAEAEELIGYVETMHAELYKLGLCANGSPIIGDDVPAPLAATGEDAVSEWRRTSGVDPITGELT